MKLVCTQSDLNTNLSLVSRAVPSRPTHPVLGNVLLFADKETQQVRLTAFDLTLGIQTSFAAQVEVGGEITIPAKLLNDIVSRLAEGEITLEEKETEATTEESGDRIIVTLTSASGRYQVRGMNSSEFPELPQVEQGVAIHLPVEALVEGLKGSLFATSSDETKQVLTGVHLTVQPDGLEFAATDGHRLAVVQTTNQNNTDSATVETSAAEDQTEPGTSVGSAPSKLAAVAIAGVSNTSELELTLPARALRELERMLGTRQSTDTVTLHFEQGQIVFQVGDQTLEDSLPLRYRVTSRTLEGQYPAYRQLIPHQFQRQITIDRRQLLSAVERIAVLADQKNNIVKFSIDSINQQLSLSVEAQDIGSGQESLPAEISGESIDIAFNVKYLIDGLKALSTSDIQMQMNTANSPVILTPLGGLKMTYLIMPVQLRG
ncbi:MAG TPA: DNA polymerase III subunit beta [Coleofasciculaceae cyanobacterium]|jgi:DNA polymerase-3 subunit beta